MILDLKNRALVQYKKAIQISETIKHKIKYKSKKCYFQTV